ncbi:MAG TPA: AAA family ATPase [Burkholderiales bacterium]|nr:AAA family ATPase [Burkholderiales bacterium]
MRPDATSSQAEAVAAHARLVRALCDPACFPDPVARVEAIETHISSVLLTGAFAYKLKKPLDLGFLDFTTLEKRRFCCEEEVRLNRRTAPSIYLDVVPVTGTLARPKIGGAGPVLDYAVRMRQFGADQTFDALLARGELTGERIDQLAACVAAFHATIAVAEASHPFGTPERVWRAARENFLQIEPFVEAAALRESLAGLRAWSEAEFARLRPVLEARRADGFVRECHGDLHLRNVALIDGQPVPFDCIEFNADLRWIDVASEIAFAVMDLLAHGASPLAWRFLNAYLEATGDYACLQALRFYLAYRSMVRAKVAAIRSRQADATAAERAHAAGELEHYVALAATPGKPAMPALIVMTGLSGSGKTRLAGSLAQQLGAIRIRSDVERKRLHGVAAQARTGAGIETGLYASEASAKTYARLAELARAVLASGFPVIADAAFLRRADRDALRSIARRANARFVLVACEAPLEVLRQRIAARERGGNDASEATVAVLERQIATREPLAPEELAEAIVCDASRPDASQAAAKKIAGQLAPGVLP